MRLARSWACRSEVVGRGRGGSQADELRARHAGSQGVVVVQSGGHTGDGRGEFPFLSRAGAVEQAARRDAGLTRKNRAWCARSGAQAARPAAQLAGLERPSAVLIPAAPACVPRQQALNA